MANGRIDITKFIEHLSLVVKSDKKEILQAIFVEDDAIIKDCYTVRGVQIGMTRVRTIGRVTEVAQPWVKPVFTHKGDIDLKPSGFKQYGHKINTSLYPTDLIGQYPGLELWVEDQDLKMQPFVRWALNEMILRQLKEDHVTKQLYNGVFVDHSGDGDGPFAAVDAMNGYQYFLMNGDALGEHFANVMAAIGELSDDAQTVYEQLNDAKKLIPEKYRSLPMNLYLAPAKQELYWEGRIKKIGLLVTNDDPDRQKISNSKISLKSSMSMIGTNDFFATVPGNLVRLIDKTGIDQGIEITKDHYRVDVMSNPYGLGYGFDYMEMVWTNIPLGGWGSGSGSGSGS
ncbi:MAG: hypothetical protein WC451_06850 [Patescibacteria group bacterium]